MRILAFSDWRIQPIERIRQIIHTENPDLILYAGDDLDRIIGFNKKLYLKTLNNFLEIDVAKLNHITINEKIVNQDQFKKAILELIKQDESLVNTIKNPIIYVNGNDDRIIEIDGERYLQFQKYLRINDKRYIIYDNFEGKIDLYLYKSPEIYFEEDLKPIIVKEDPPENYAEENGIYIKISPLLGKTIIRKYNDSISIFGSGCSFGLESKVIEPPEEYCDIYLTHLPPIGILDLSARFGISHIGSTEILGAILEYGPRLVICGHSHIWGGLGEKVNNSTIINVSSQDNPRFQNEGNYAIIDTDYWSYEFKELKQDPSYFSMKKIRGFSTIRNKLRRLGRIYFPIETMRNIIEKYEIISSCLAADYAKKKFYIDPQLWKEQDHLEQDRINKIMQSEFKIDLNESLEQIKNGEELSKKIYRTHEIKEVYKVLDQLDEFKIDITRYRSRLKSMIENKFEILRSITFNPRNCYFVDVETGLAKGDEPGELWLIGIGNGWEKKINQYYYPKQKKTFIKFMKDNYINTLISWTTYDSKSLKPILESEGLEVKFYDACQRTANCLIWKTYKLHELYSALFPNDKSFPDEIIPGRIAGLYADHLILNKNKCPYCSDRKDEIINEIKKRNRIDILQMIKICEFLYRKD